MQYVSHRVRACVLSFFSPPDWNGKTRPRMVEISPRALRVVYCARFARTPTSAVRTPPPSLRPPPLLPLTDGASTSPFGRRTSPVSTAIPRSVIPSFRCFLFFWRTLSLPHAAALHLKKKNTDKKRFRVAPPEHHHPAWWTKSDNPQSPSSAAVDDSAATRGARWCLAGTTSHPVYPAAKTRRGTVVKTFASASRPTLSKTLRIDERTRNVSSTTR